MPAALHNYRRFVEQCEVFSHPSVSVEHRGPMYAVFTGAKHILLLAVLQRDGERQWYVAGDLMPASWRIRISALHPRWASTSSTQDELQAMWNCYTGGV